MKKIAKVLVSIICLVLLAVFTTGCEDKRDIKNIREEQNRVVRYTVQNFEDVKKIEFSKNYDFENLSGSKKVLYKYV